MGRWKSPGSTGCHPATWLPRDDAVDEFALFGRCATQVDSRRFNALMAHEVREKRDVVAFLQKVLGEPVAEGMRIDDRRVHFKLAREYLELVRNAAGCDALAEAIAEEISAPDSFRGKPRPRFVTQLPRDVEAPQLPALSVEIEESGFDVFRLELDEFRNAGACRAEKSHDEIPERPARRLEAPGEETVVRVADDILEERRLLDFDEPQFERRLLQEVEKAVDRLKTEIDRLRLVVLDEESLEREKGSLVDLVELAEEGFDRLPVGADRVCGQLLAFERTRERIDGVFHG